MKRKLITFLLTMLVIAGFQAKADPVLVTIQTGDSLPAVQTNPVLGVSSFTNERGGYAGKIGVTPNKLTFNEATGKFVYRKGAPETNSGSADRIYVSNENVNFFNFTSGTHTLTLEYSDKFYSDFVVFTGRPQPVTNNYRRVTNYYQTDLGAATTIVTQIVTPQDFNKGNFEGFLAIQAGGYVDDANLLIVVHDKAGALSLMPYGEYVESLDGDLEKIDRPYFPLYIKSNPITGRWATPNDFAGHKFWQFTSQGKDAAKDQVLTVYDAEETFKNTTNNPYDIFTVKQVDFVQNGDKVVSGGTTAHTNNIITHRGGAKFEGMNRFGATTNPGTNPTMSVNYGTAWNADVSPVVGTGRLGDSIIPLFVLATPENNCQVLSISRINHLYVESEADAGYADRLEVREYGSYYYFTKNQADFKNPLYADYKQGYKDPGAYGTVADSIFDVYTSLQKFAIWIDEDGNFTLYPAAAYIWKYGENKYVVDAGVRIMSNAVLVYNDINVYYKSGAGFDPITYADRVDGWQIGWWNGRNNYTNKASDEDGFNFTTIPNNPQTVTDYLETPNYLSYVGENTDIKNRFYFMDILNPDTIGFYNKYSNAAWTNAWKANGYQWYRDHVLSTAIWDSHTVSGASINGKYLHAVVKEKNRGLNTEYWDNPYDSVNMAAHWEAQQIKDSEGNKFYRFINMLGDTLKFDALGSNNLSGGYLPVNKLIPGANPVDPYYTYTCNTQTPLYADAGQKYFGRPGTALGNPVAEQHWFDRNPHQYGLGYDTWKIYQLPDKKNGGFKDYFYMELMNNETKTENGVTYPYQVELVFDQAGGWFTHDYVGNPAPAMFAGNNTMYYQSFIFPKREAYGQYKSYSSYQGDVFSTCPGLRLKLSDIKYVPTHEQYIGLDSDNGIINTSDDKGFLYQDSLTAYTFLTGSFDIVEATQVQTNLKLSYEAVNRGDGITVNQARLRETSIQTNFLPLGGEKGQLRKAQITAAGGDNLGTLWNETYKWYLVECNGKYLSFDTVAINAAQNRYKVGLVFTDSLINAIPVRLYQPLVGDKEKGNFMFQFYMPKYKYYWYGTNNATRGRWATSYPDIEGSGTAAFTDPCKVDEVCFGFLPSHSSFLHAVRAYSSVEVGTRFTFIQKDVYKCPCIGEFIKPDWMAQERLLNFPLNNQIWWEDAPVSAWIAKGVAVTGGNSAIVANVGEEDKATTLKHTYVTTIHKFNYGSGQSVYPNSTALNYNATSHPYASVYIPIPGTSNNDQKIAASFTGFATDTIVPLYYVQNADGKYLTVVTKNDARNDRETDPDVSGVKLEWLDKYEWNSTWYGTNGYDRRALQLFAISGCQEGQPDADGAYGKWIYLPLASYLYDYTNRVFITNLSGTYKDKYVISYNLNLGKTFKNASGCVGNDVTDCYRVSYMTRIDDPVKHLVVFNANSGIGAGSFVPVEFKVTKEKYVLPECDYFLVQNTAKYANATTIRNRYYDALLPALRARADKYTLSAHWTFETGKYNDDEIVNFVPELETVYEWEVGSAEVPRYHLTGDYYFLKELSAADKVKEYSVIDISDYIDYVYTPSALIWDYTPGIDTLTIKCVDHAVPYYDLEASPTEADPYCGGDFNIDVNKLAILETPFLDRNLSYRIKDMKDGSEELIPIYNGGTKLLGYQALIQRLDLDKQFKDADLVTIYRENRRKLSEEHIIPYYAFSVTKGDVEYFLNVLPGGLDSVRWTVLTDAQREELYDWETYPNSFPTYKFCLPFKWVDDKSGGFVRDIIEYGDTEYPAVYLQTLDLAVNDYPYEVIVGAASKYITARPIYDPNDHPKNSIITTGTPATNSLLYNIYTIDYTAFNEEKVTAWIFGGPMPGGNIWVPLVDVAWGEPGGTTEGALTNYGLDKGGVSFIAESKEAPVNYGILTGAKNAKNLTVKFKGDTLIGSWALRPIWYYNVISDGKYLTDADGETADMYKYLFNGKYYKYAFFTTAKTEFTAYKNEGIFADEKFVQTFGFRYVTDDQAEDQEFYIVSNANYKTPRAEKYRYLAQINDQMVFVDTPEDALVFQWGKLTNGEYTGLDIIGKGGIFGVEGGVKLLNTTGKVDIYSVDGRLINSTELTGTETTIAVPRGLVVVKNGANVVKVVVQ